MAAPLFRVRFFDQTDSPDQPLLQANSTTTDLAVFITRHSSSSSRHTMLPSFEIRVSYNQVLFSLRRVTPIFEQLLTILEKGAEDEQILISEISLLTKSSAHILPDPTANLKWKDYQGAITDIFANNADLWPDRRYVIENAEGKRVFTYRHIHEASNLVAHFLIHGGIGREDVVMIYAYRGVDLVVAVMGVLKVGATFSVIG